MKIEKISAGILALLVVMFCIVYFTLPKQGEQIYIPQDTSLTPPVEIPDGYHLVDNYSDVYYVETENGYRYFWLVQFSDGSYGWQEVDENGNIILPGHSGNTEASSETDGQAEPAEPTGSEEPTNSAQDELSQSATEPAE